ncbi:MAG: hypothetical protein WBA23_08990 [Tunicatimonas sp.]|uniref:hypothetical protein n=1 Tax=Tunicatimonas sp. TaxID=1940096 RepID=UPI003C7932BD
MLHHQYITDSKGERISVIVPVKEFEDILQKLEDLEDIYLYDKAKQTPQEFVDADQAFREIEEVREKDV